MTGTSAPQSRAERDYRPAFLVYLSRRDEAARTAGYDLGRLAVERGTTLLELVQAHHTTLLEVLPAAHDPAGTADVCTAASEFLSEVVASFAMASAALPEVQQRLGAARAEVAELRRRPGTSGGARPGR